MFRSSLLYKNSAVKRSKRRKHRGHDYLWWSKQSPHRGLSWTEKSARLLHKLMKIVRGRRMTGKHSCTTIQLRLLIATTCVFWLANHALRQWTAANATRAINAVWSHSPGLLHTATRMSSGQIPAVNELVLKVHCRTRKRTFDYSLETEIPK